MNFKFDHSQEKLYDAIGVSDEELVAVELKNKKVKDIYLEAVIENAMTNTTEEKVSMSQLIEIYDAQFTKEELAIITAISLKVEVMNFFESNQEMIGSLLTVITKGITNTNTPKTDKDGK